MRLTSYTNYALRILMVAAMRSPRLSRVHEVADAFGISKAHLVKCVHQLGLWGYLENVRGRHGGFRLARPAGAITVGEIVRRTEDSLDLVECFAPDTNTCPLIGTCRLGCGFRRALDAFFLVLDGMTVADLVADRAALQAALGLAEAERPAA